MKWRGDHPHLRKIATSRVAGMGDDILVPDQSTEQQLPKLHCQGAVVVSAGPAVGRYLSGLVNRNHFLDFFVVFWFRCHEGARSSGKSGFGYEFLRPIRHDSHAKMAAGPMNLPILASHMMKF